MGEQTPLLGLPGQALTNGPVIIPVGSDGSATFEVEVPVDMSPLNGYLAMENAATGESVGQYGLHTTWRIPPPLPLEVHRMTLREWVSQFDPPGLNRLTASEALTPIYILKWAGASDGLVPMIEAARDVDGAEWFPVEDLKSHPTGLPILQHLTGPVPCDAVPLKFRILPIRFSRP